MKTNIKVNENVRIVKEKTADVTRIAIYDNDKKVLVSSFKAKNNNIDVKYDNNYIVIYSIGSMTDSIKGAYNIKNRKVVDLDDTIKGKLEQMLVNTKGFRFTDMETFLNNDRSSREKRTIISRITNYLTGGNKEITRRQMIEYIFNKYPELKNYKNKTSNKETVYWFHMMPQIVDDKKEFDIDTTSKELQEFLKDLDNYMNSLERLAKENPELYKKVSADALLRSGIIDEHGNLKPPYNGEKVNEDDFERGPKLERKK